jgi:ABC-type nitrate/sulfonate/bicarbonate transport system permease component
MRERDEFLATVACIVLGLVIGFAIGLAIGLPR